eukprot:COSAG02_NODE_322_length_24779_cov_14.118233_2_plen_85_part_00
MHVFTCMQLASSAVCRLSGVSSALVLASRAYSVLVTPPQTVLVGRPSSDPHAHGTHASKIDRVQPRAPPAPAGAGRGPDALHIA